MGLLYFTGGLVVGIIVMLLLQRNEKIHGIIEVDHADETCKIHVTSNELADRKVKVVTFYVDHNADFSRDKQTL